MVGASLPGASAVPIGKAVGWRLTIAGQTVDHRACWAEIAVSLDSGLSPGSVELNLRGVTEDQFKAIAEAWVRRETAPGETVPRRALVTGKLQIFWRDKVGAEPSEAQVPPVMEFALTSLSRRSEGLQFVTKIEGRHTIYEKIDRAIARTNSDRTQGEGPITAAAVVLQAGGLDPDSFTECRPDQPGSEEWFDIQSGRQVLAQLTALGDAMLRRYNRRGRGVYLIRDGKLLVGPFWPVPPRGRSIIALTAEGGFISAQMQGQEQAVGDREDRHSDDPPPPARDLWQIQAVGRTDIAPGDVVRIEVPRADSGLSGGFGLPSVAGALTGNEPVCVYVDSVRHSSARDRGWTIEIAGVAVVESSLPAGAWYSIAATTHGVPTAGEAGPRADSAGSVRARIGTAIAEEMAHRPQNDIAEVRAFHATTDASSGTVARAAQSSDLIVGVDDRTGGGGARRAEINRARATRRASNAPYLTPFAWGEYGQVLPRYPGTRVMLAYHHNSPQDAVDIGALWQTDGTASAPQAAQAGDWWLILPAGASTQEAAGTAAVAPPQDGKASHDLIDANGERRIEVNGFTIRSFDANNLKGPGERPSPPDGDNMQGGILIHHKGSDALISIATDGKITIKATGELVLQGEGIKLKPGSGTVDVE